MKRDTFSVAELARRAGVQRGTARAWLRQRRATQTAKQGALEAAYVSLGGVLTKTDPAGVSPAAP